MTRIYSLNRQMKMERYKPLYEDIEDFKKAIQKSEELPQVIIFLGTEHQFYENLIEAYEERIRSLRPPLELFSANGLEADAQQFHAELFTVPLFSSSRLVVLKHSETLFKKIQTDPIVKKHFENDIRNIPLSTFLFIQLDSNSLPQSLSYLRDMSILIKPRVLRGKNIFNHFKSKADSLNITVSSDVIEALMKKCGWEFQSALRVFDQLVLYSKKVKKITLEIVEDFCDDLQGDLYFDIIDHIAERKIAKCIEKLNQHKYSDSMQILSGFSKLFTDAYRFKKYRSMGLSHSSIYEKLRMADGHPYIVKKNEQRIQNILKYYSESSFVKIFKRLVKLDEQLKTESKEKERTLLTMFAASLENC